MKAMIIFCLAGFLLVVSPALADINVIVRADLSKIKFSEGREFSEEMEFRGGKAIWEEYGDFYFAFYSEKALKVLVESDSTYVVLAPGGESIKPAFGNLYFVTRNILWGVGEEYGLNPETYYVWLVEFKLQGMNLKDENGISYHQGLAPFGDWAVKEVKENGNRITKDYLSLLASGN
jgi:hypothetical protein